MLSDVAEFLRNLKEIAHKVPIEVWGPVLVGTAVAGGFAGWHARRILKRGPTEAISIPPPLPVPNSDMEKLIEALDRDDAELWQFHRSTVPHDLLDLIHKHGLKVLALINLKGGVGKTTLAANLAAYFVEKGLRVLLIDFDYQGSLSAAVLLAAGRTDTYSEADKVLLGRLTGADLASANRTMAPRLAKLTLIPAEYELNRQETRLLMRWLLQADKLDPRYALARVLSSPEVLKTFNVVIIDTPPRLGLATLNALCASTHVVIPTILNGGSIGNVQSLLGQLNKWFRQDLNPRLDLAGIVPTMTATATRLDDTERQARLTVEAAAQQFWGPRAGGIAKLQGLEDWPHDAYVLAETIPDAVRFREDAGRDIAFLDRRASNQQTRDKIAAVGDRIKRRIGL